MHGLLIQVMNQISQDQPSDASMARGHAIIKFRQQRRKHTCTCMHRYRLIHMSVSRGIATVTRHRNRTRSEVRSTFDATSLGPGSESLLKFWLSVPVENQFWWVLCYMLRISTIVCSFSSNSSTWATVTIQRVRTRVSEVRL